MINQINKTFSLTIILLLNLLYVSGQTEFLVSINRGTGIFNKIDSLPGVKWINTSPSYLTFNENNHHFIFKGGDNIGNQYLYTVDATTGLIISNPSFPILSDPADNIIELQYDNSSNKLYGLNWDASENREYFVTIDATTGMTTIIDSLPNVKGISIIPHCTTYNKNNHSYIFRGCDNGGNWYLYSIDANTGNITSNPPFPNLLDPSDNITELHYDNSSNKLYGLHWNNSENREYLVTVNPTTGTFTKIDSLPGVLGTAIPHFTIFNEINHQYIFKGCDNTGNFYLYSVDAISGNIISNPLFPVLEDPSDNVIELQFDNSSGNLYALHWDANTLTGLYSNEKDKHTFNLYPNPFSYSSKIIFDKIYREITIFVYNSSGQVVRKETNFNSATINIQKDNLSNGVYFISVLCDHQGIGMRKIVIE